jgi:hypothetical protein
MQATLTSLQRGFFPLCACRLQVDWQVQVGVHHFVQARQLELLAEAALEMHTSSKHHCMGVQISLAHRACCNGVQVPFAPFSSC